MKSKTKKRTEFLRSIMNELKSEKIYNVINYNKQGEDKIKQFIYPNLLRFLEERYKSRQKAEKSLLWEGNVKTTVKNILSFGVFHRPDMVIEDDDMSIAIEIKKGEKGTGIREGIGQSIVYSTVYDFVLYLFIDITKEKRIAGSLSDNEQKIINSLWINHNIMFDII